MHTRWLLVAALVAFPLVASAQERKRDEQRIAQVYVEALALEQAASKVIATDLTALCRAISKSKSLRLSELWGKLCEPKPPLASIRSCAGSFFACQTKEDMAVAQGNMIPGGSFDCEAKAKRCKAPSQ